ncbi:MFS transporter [Nocardioides deserti]|uniref:MFS transporter n=1 Tax=Nocardioides deserti TaxID=1588644 RepID=A0ABR6U9C4_9ACTN|nr:MFS transporter [Nocardioides deserti]MBC2960713.1 MFS transporter [Nocardioides deserti]GGO77156.1 MFS transporter [Nocardioides deserti]
MADTSAPPAPALLRTRNAVGLTFGLNGLLFASLVSRLPDIRARLDLDNGALGLLLLAISIGSILALPATGRLIGRYGAARVVRAGVVACAVGLSGAGVAAGVLGSVPATAGAFFVYGIGIGVWDVAMNVEGAEVERRLARTVMPRFHAGWSLGSIAGAGIGIPLTAVSLPMPVHLAAGCVVALLVVWWAAATFLPPEPAVEHSERPRSAWTEPRLLAIGLMVLAFAVAEGAANDWLTLALIDGYAVEHWVGVAGFALFVTAMTGGRLLGPVVLDRFGRAPTLWASCAAACAGILLTVLGGHVVLVALGILVWGLGSSLGFPVGMSAAADDPGRAAARVSVVSTIGYGAFLAGPPLLGLLGDHVGTLDALLVVAALMVPAAAAVLAARPRVPGAPSVREPA